MHLVPVSYLNTCYISVSVLLSWLFILSQLCVYKGLLYCVIRELWYEKFELLLLSVTYKPKRTRLHDTQYYWGTQNGGHPHVKATLLGPNLILNRPVRQPPLYYSFNVCLVLSHIPSFLVSTKGMHFVGSSVIIELEISYKISKVRLEDGKLNSKNLMQYKFEKQYLTQ